MKAQIELLSWLILFKLDFMVIVPVKFCISCIQNNLGVCIFIQG